MIMRLVGTVGAAATDWVLVEVHGVGYRVEVPISLAAKCLLGAPIEVWTHLVVREDAHILFGFETREALECFWRLITVSGVGPKLAQKILASYTPSTVYEAIERGDDALFVRVSGVGKKTAQKLILDLRGSIVLEADSAKGATDTELTEALESLGYTAADAKKMAAKTPVGQGTLEEKLRAVLRSGV
jgi:Holliday junction DNA helicase RuvA